MDDKEKIADLEKQVESLKKRLAIANNKIVSLQTQLQKQYRYTQDYCPYPEENDGR